MDPFEELGMTAQNAEQHRRSATEKQVRLHEYMIVSLDCFFAVYICGFLTRFLELNNYEERAIY